MINNVGGPAVVADWVTIVCVPVTPAASVWWAPRRPPGLCLVL